MSWVIYKFLLLRNSRLIPCPGPLRRLWRHLRHGGDELEPPEGGAGDPVGRPPPGQQPYPPRQRLPQGTVAFFSEKIWLSWINPAGFAILPIVRQYPARHAGSSGKNNQIRPNPRKKNIVLKHPYSQKYFFSMPGLIFWRQPAWTSVIMAWQKRIIGSVAWDCSVG